MSSEWMGVDILDSIDILPCGDMIPYTTSTSAYFYILRDKHTKEINIYTGHCDNYYGDNDTPHILSTLIAYGNKIPFDEFCERINNIRKKYE